MAKNPEKLLEKLALDPIRLARAREGLQNPAILPPISGKVAPSVPSLGHNADAGELLYTSIKRLRLFEQEIAAINAKKSAVYKTLRKVGYDIHTIRQTASQMKLDPRVREERRALIEFYWQEIEQFLADDGGDEGDA